MEPILSALNILFAASVVAGVLSMVRLSRLRRRVSGSTLAPTLGWCIVTLSLAVAEAAAFVAAAPVLLHHLLAIATSIAFVLPTIFLLCARRPRLVGAHAIVAVFFLIASNTLWLQWLTGQYAVPGRPGLHQVRFFYLALFTVLVAGNHVLSRLRIPVLVATGGALVHLLSVGPWPLHAEPYLRGFGLLLLSAAPLWPVRLPTATDAAACVVRLFVDLWGVGWWEHLRERFNDAARRRRWRLRLTRNGFVHAADETPLAAGKAGPEAMEELLRLLERFAPRTFFAALCSTDTPVQQEAASAGSDGVSITERLPRSPATELRPHRSA